MLAIYNSGMGAPSYVMTVSQNGQVSIPADTRSRWKARRVVVVDLGDRVVMRPLPDDAVEGLEGKYRGRGPTTDESRRQARREASARAASR
jgi:bifunctional DNA-binding transcriptional regulator/antitoxin component of YhaV-PrlF toxin-antitoxin module